MPGPGKRMSKTKSKSKHVCQRCGCAVHWWMDRTWKHAAGRGRRSCGQLPLVMVRTSYEKWMDETTIAAVNAVRRHLDR